MNKELKDEIINIYLRYRLLGLRPVYKCYYFDYENDNIILTGFVDELDVYKYWKRNATLIIDDVFEVIDIETDIKENSEFGYQTSYTFPYKLELGSNVKYIKKLHLGYKLFYTIQTNSSFSIEKEAFKYENNLVEFISDGCRSIGDHAFSGCYSLCKIVLPQCLSVGEAAFLSCYSLKYVDVSSIETIPRSLCGDCPHLEIFIAPNSTSIDNYAFTFSNKIKRIELGAINNMETDAFFHCSVTYCVDEKKVLFK